METAGGRVAAGEDRLSALPDDLLLEIILRLGSTYQAVRTSRLARRWRNLWRNLPEVCFEDNSPDRLPDGYQIREFLLQGDQELHSVTVIAPADSVTAWLPAAARRLVGSLVLKHKPSSVSDHDADQESAGIQLPLFQHATEITMELGFVDLSLPPQGIFSLLRYILMSGVIFSGPCDVGICFSSARSPCLHTLQLDRSRGFNHLTINSNCLVNVELNALRRLELFIIESNSLQDLVLKNCFTDNPTDVTAYIASSSLVSLNLIEIDDPRFIRLGETGNIRLLKIKLIAYGDEYHRVLNQGSLKLLRHCKDLQCLYIHLIHYLLVGYQYTYLLEDLVAMPPITMLEVHVHSIGHGFGTAILHLLQTWSAITRFDLDVVTTLSGESECTPDSDFEDLVGWTGEELKLTYLEDINIVIHGYRHEVALLQRLLHFATALKRFRMTLRCPDSEHETKEVHKAVKAFISPEVYSEFDTCD